MFLFIFYCYIYKAMHNYNIRKKHFSFFYEENYSSIRPFLNGFYGLPFFFRPKTRQGLSPEQGHKNIQMILLINCFYLCICIKIYIYIYFYIFVPLYTLDHWSTNDEQCSSIYKDFMHCYNNVTISYLIIQPWVLNMCILVILDARQIMPRGSRVITI